MKDKTPSFAVNIGSIGGCYCHASTCRKRIGSIVHLEKELCNLQTDKEAARQIYHAFIHPVIEFDAEFGNLLTTFKSNLLNKSPDLLQILKGELGFDIDSITPFQYRMGLGEETFYISDL